MESNTTVLAKFPKLVNIIIKNRWPLVAILFLGDLAIEFNDHLRISKQISVAPELPRHVIIYGMILPIIIGLLLTMISNIGKEKNVAQDAYQLQTMISNQLNTANQLDQVIDIIVRAPPLIAPVLGASLFIFEVGKHNTVGPVEWRADGQADSITDVKSVKEVCRNCPAEGFTLKERLFPCNYQVDGKTIHECKRYCLPLRIGDRLIAILHIDYQSEVPLHLSQVQLLNRLAPEMAMAVENAILQKQARYLASATEAERKQIARDLHDTLGQNIAYLRLKMDQLSGDSPQREISEIRVELERMRQVADEAYNQVRGTLDDLRGRVTGSLYTMLVEQARNVSERAELTIDSKQEGHPLLLPTTLTRQVLQICREALNNIEKHAGAKHVDIHIAWEEDEFTVRITDDGRGFIQDTIPAEGHYGLLIMRERAAEIQATLEYSCPNMIGTEVSLRVPLHGYPQSLIEKQLPVEVL